MSISITISNVHPYEVFDRPRKPPDVAQRARLPLNVKVFSINI